MNSILILGNKPGDCFNCQLHFHNINICAYLKKFGPDGCPLKEISEAEHKERPLSKEKYTQIYTEGWTKMPKSCENCVNCDKVKLEGKDEFWACDEYGIVYLGVPANCAPPNDCACEFWTDDPTQRHKRYNEIMNIR